MHTQLLSFAGLLNTAIEKVIFAVASKDVPPGLQTALRHVPTWTHAHQVLEEHLSAYLAGGASASVGAGFALKKFGLGKILSKGAR